MKRCAVVGLVAVLAVMAFAQNRPGAAGTAPRQADTLRLLNQRIPEVSFPETPFEQVMEWVTDFTQANVIVKWQILTDAGVPRDKPITLKVKNLRLSQVLWMIMNEAGGTDVKLAYRASGNMIIFSTQDDLNTEMVVKVYDVSDLLVRIPNASAQPSLDPSQAMNQIGQGGTGGGGGGGSSGLFTNNQNNQGYDDRNNSNDMRNGEVAVLMDLITQTIEPDSWQANGGTGTIQAFRGTIVVRNTLLIHQKINGFLSEGIGQ